MTRREFELALEGRRRRFEHVMEALAWHAAHIINYRTPAFGEDVKKRKLLTPHDLLGRERPQSLEASARIWREFLRPFKKPEARGA